MKKIEILTIPCLLLTLAVALAPAHGQALTNTTIVHNGTAPFGEGPNPCTGLMDTGTLTYNLVMHITVDSNGEVHTTISQTGDINVVEENGVVYTGHIHFVFSVNLQFLGDGRFVTTMTVAGHATGSDGSMIRVFAIQHITLKSITGPPTVEFERMTLSCS